MPKRTAVDRRARALRRKVTSTASGPESARPPTWIKPQLTRLAEEAPEGTDWLHEIKYDGYRMHARIDGDNIQLLTRNGLDWSKRYPYTVSALRSLRVKTAYILHRRRTLRPPSRRRAIVWTAAGRDGSGNDEQPGLLCLRPCSSLTARAPLPCR
jgi:hypothetical protein